MLLNEIFNDTNIPVHWQGNMATFELGEHNYIIQFIHMSEGDQIHEKVSQFPVTDSTYFFAFAAEDMDSGEVVDTDTGIRESIKIFSVVLQELQKFAQQKQMDMLYFGCDRDHPGRRRLYQKMVNKYTASGNWKLIGEADASFFCEDKHIWVIKKV